MSRAIRTPMIAMTTNSSTSVKPRRFVFAVSALTEFAARAMERFRVSQKRFTLPAPPVVGLDGDMAVNCQWVGKVHNGDGYLILASRNLKYSVKPGSKRGPRATG